MLGVLHCWEIPALLWNLWNCQHPTREVFVNCMRIVPFTFFSFNLALISPPGCDLVSKHNATHNNVALQKSTIFIGAGHLRLRRIFHYSADMNLYILGKGALFAEPIIDDSPYQADGLVHPTLQKVQQLSSADCQMLTWHVNGSSRVFSEKPG